MNREDIIRMAREAGKYADSQTNCKYDWQHIRDERFAALVAAAERKAFKPRKWTEEMRHAWHQSIPDLELAFDELIRARGDE